MELNEELIGKLVEFDCYGKHYNEVLVTISEKGGVELLNNCHSNCNDHKDKSKYRYSLFYDNFKRANEDCSNVKLKESFDAQNKPKFIEKWSVGSYVVSLQNKLLVRNEPLVKGKIYNIVENNILSYIRCESGSRINFETDEELIGVKWFATKSEAEEFAKTLVAPVKEEVKQPLKQAVHCKTQEEWDFVTEKLGYIWDRFTDWNIHKEKTFISLYSTKIGHIDINSYNNQILSFQEWRDLNGYKMESKYEFIEGKWYRVEYLNTKNVYYLKYINSRHEFGYSEYIDVGRNSHSIYTNGNDLCVIPTPILTPIEEIQQYLPESHPDKITPVIKQTRDMQEKGFKKGDYIVVLRPKEEDSRYVKYNWCFIHSGISADYFATEKDCSGSYVDVNTIKFDSNLWRYATSEEITEYNRIDKPYDVSTLKSNQEFKVGDYVVRECSEGNIIYQVETVMSDGWLCGKVEGSGYSKKILHHAITKEIIQYLISTGVISVDSINIENCLVKTHIPRMMSLNDTEYWTKENDRQVVSEKPILSLSIDDEELSMVSIIKTKTVKQLLSIN